nr:2-acyl-glycerophospho-ethanolamine acyltransferase [Rhizobiaceae bacterium]
RGRAKRFAKIAGEMVSLGAVEMLVQSLGPEDRHAAVSIPDKRKGERIVLATTVRDANRVTIHEFGRHAGVTELMIPSDVITVDEIPVLGSGKTDYVTTQKVVKEKLGV